MNSPTKDVVDVARELQVVTILELQVDHRYQRDLNQNLVEKILRKWDMVAADAITVSQRDDGSLWIVNGQHRCAAASLAGETEMLAFVYTGLTLEEEAALRLKANNRRSDSPLERFHGQVTAGDKESLAIKAICEEADTRVNRTMNKSTGINCVSALESVYRVDAGFTLRATLRLLRDTFGEVSGDVAQEPVIRGTAWFIRTHAGEFVRAELRSKMSRAGVDEIVRKARSHRSAMGGSLWVNYYRALVEVYNHHRKVENRLDWRTKSSGQMEYTNKYGNGEYANG